MRTLISNNTQQYEMVGTRYIVCDIYVSSGLASIVLHSCIKVFASDSGIVFVKYSFPPLETWEQIYFCKFLISSVIAVVTIRLHLLDNVPVEYLAMEVTQENVFNWLLIQYYVYTIQSCLVGSFLFIWALEMKFLSKYSLCLATSAFKVVNN